MNSIHNDEFERPISSEFIKKGYGQFPYVIIRMHHAIYMQIPIHFEENKRGNFPGIHINMHDEQRKEVLYQCLIPSIINFKTQIDQKSQKPHRLCLVLNKNQAYYFEDDLIKFKTSIPRGGTLVDSNKQFIAMSSNHYSANQKFVSC